MTKELESFYQHANQPASRDLILGAITRLAVHKRIDGGNSRIKVITEDLARDLQGVSEWVVKKVCDDYRHDPSPFFPTVGDFVQRASDLQSLVGSIRVKGGKPMQRPEQTEVKPKDNSQWVKDLCTAYPNKDYSVIEVIPKIHALLVKKPGIWILEKMAEEVPSVPFGEWLDQKIQSVA